MVLALPSIRFSRNFYQIIYGTKYEKKTCLGPIICHLWQDNGKKGHFSWNFDRFLTFFMDCDHIYVPNGKTWGSISRPHIGYVVMSLFFTLGLTVHDWGWPKNGPFWTKKGQTWQACQHSKVVQKGSERDQNGQTKCF